MSEWPTRIIEPFSERVAGPDMISFGLQPAGYDARLAPDVKIVDWARGMGRLLDPLNVDESLCFESGPSDSRAIIIPPHGFIVGTTVEFFRIPRSCVVRGAAKTTYSSIGVNINVASIHPGWEGRLRLHISNATPVPVLVYPGMGIVYLEFHEIDGVVERDYSQLNDTRFMDVGA